MNESSAPSDTLRVRITVVNPPPGVTFMMQEGRSALVAPVQSSPEALVFEFTVRVGRQRGGAPNFLGPFTQGPPASRFVYVNSGTLAGQAASCWSRRAKVPLTSIEWPLIERAIGTGAVIETEFEGTGRDGGPTCASVRLVGGWHLAEGPS